MSSHSTTPFAVVTLLSAVLAVPAFAAEAWKPEVHAFTSFGWLDTSGNQWLGESLGGSSEFWEAAANATIHPLPDFSASGQLFARDFQRYDNGRAQVDWLYGEWRPDDAFCMQVGRVKYPFGLFNEVRDVDAARATVFLPISVYPLRARDLYNSTDGAKASGLIHVGPAGSLEYAAFGGHTDLSSAGGFATFLSDTGYGNIERIELEAVYGGMLHWHTPVEGLGARVTAVNLHRLVLEGRTATTRIKTIADPYWTMLSSLIYDHGPVTIAGEASMVFGTTKLRVESLSGTVLSETSRPEKLGAGYVSCTWHLPADVDLTAGAERLWTDYRHLGVPQSTRGVLAARWGLTEHWSVKAEYQRIVGPGGATKADNPDGVRTPWNLFALKTTVDF